MKLKASKLRTMKPGRHGDGQHGLYFNVKDTGGRSWVQRLVIDGRRRTFGLGPWPVVSLSEARELAFENVRKRHKGQDPIAERRKAKAMPSFRETAAAVLAKRGGDWTERTRRGFQRSINIYARSFADRPVGAVTKLDVIAALAADWQVKPAAAKLARLYIKQVFDHAVALGHRGDNPGNGEVLTALGRQTRQTAHHEAIDFRALPDTMPAIRGYTGRVVALALEFAILTATRGAEVRGARWGEFDLDAAVWAIPGERMKAKRDHRVPLSRQAIEILTEARELGRGSDLVFPGKTGGAMADRTLGLPLKAAKLAGTVHGMRSAFRDWAIDNKIEREVAEAALAHSIALSKIEQAYLRHDLVEQRRSVMQAWADHLAGRS